MTALLSLWTNKKSQKYWGNNMDHVFLSIILLAIFILYLLPYSIALSKQKKNSTAILWADLLLGWTFIGWAVCLVWALTEDSK
jgi:ABC-type proline/glycine betaine transport system permease subunit